MTDTRYTYLGPNPLWTGLQYWGFTVLMAAMAWEGAVRFPRAGLVLIGITPFVNLYCFFRGLTAMGQALRRLGTVRAARRLGLRPDWGCSSGGFMLLDEEQGLWAGNGKGGTLAGLGRLVRHTDGQAHYLEFWPQGAERPLARVGFGSEAELEEVALRVEAAVRRAGGAPEMARVDPRL